MKFRGHIRTSNVRHFTRYYRLVLLSVAVAMTVIVGSFCIIMTRGSSVG